ncbi:MAG TPA: hypothetical protein VMW42_09730 [Desulfatiglandales bacterium]|nr:hypothetical protein [Desulfatiglandales bacterium]
MADLKICPIMSAGPEVRPCVKERCQFWVQHTVTPPKGGCLFNAIRTALHLISIKQE